MQLFRCHDALSDRLALPLMVCRFAMGGIFSVQMLMRRTELSVTTKLSTEHETPSIANLLLVLAFLVLLSICYKNIIHLPFQMKHLQ